MLSDFLTKEKEWGEYYTKTQIKDGVEDIKIPNCTFTH